MKLRHRVVHALRKPLPVIAWKLAQRSARHVRRYGFWDRLSQSVFRDLQNATVADMRRELLRAPQLIEPGDGAPMAAARINQSNSTEAAALLSDADRALALEFAYLGWKRTFESLPLPWCSDWKTGRRWESRYYADYDYSEFDVPSDVKSCWEPSRFHFGVRLGQAYRLSGDERYRAQLFRLLRDWSDSNPFARSINWTSPLEVAIRGVNLAVALSLVIDDLDERDLRFITGILALHGAFLFRNIEFTDVRGNHYAGNLLGLLTLGLLLENLVPGAKRWRQYAEARVGREVLLQFHPDGVNREKSIAYHRFVTEIFLLCAVLLQRAGRPMSAAVLDRLRLAVKFTSAYIRPDGVAPIIGDSDDARALPLSSNSVGNHDHLVDAYAAFAGHTRREGAGQSSEAVWLFPEASLVDEVKSGVDSVNSDVAFPDGGFYVARRGQHYFFVDAGYVGLQSGGCHGHHDMLSFELALDGVALIVDSGSPEYTGNVDVRNQFRRTAAHNTVRVDGMEQGSFDPSRLWHLGAEALPRNVVLKSTENHTTFSGSHSGYERLPDPVVHRRELVLHSNGRFEGRDSIEGKGEHQVELFFHFHPQITISADGTGLVLSDHSKRWRFTWNPAQTETAIEHGEISPAYGVRLPSSTLVVRHAGQLPWTFEYRIERI